LDEAETQVNKMQVKLGIIGCGAIAEAMHLPAAAACEDANVIVLIDSNVSRANTLAQRFQVPHTATSLDEVADQLDAVILATPPHLRVELARRAFEMGLHVLCEKPLANSTAECDEIIDAARRADRVLAVAHIFRFYPSRVAVRELLARGEIGRVSNGWVSQGNPYSWQTHSGYNMRTGLVPGGVLFDAGVHPLDTLLWWFGDPEWVSYEDDSLGGLESNVRLRMEFPGGCKIHFRQSRTCRLPNEFRLVGENGTVVLSNYDPRCYELIRNGRTVIIETDQVEQVDCERRQLQDFLEVVRNGRAPHVTGADGRSVIRLIERCYAERSDRRLTETAPLPGLTW
jgi:predicted dehydrogenase